MLNLFQVCSPPLTKNGLVYSVETQKFPNTWLGGDKITYQCTGRGQTGGNLVNECQDNGQWSLPSQSLPSCCMFNTKIL